MDEEHEERRRTFRLEDYQGCPRYDAVEDIDKTMQEYIKTSIMAHSDIASSVRNTATKMGSVVTLLGTLIFVVVAFGVFLFYRIEDGNSDHYTNKGRLDITETRMNNMYNRMIECSTDMREVQRHLDDKQNHNKTRNKND